MLHESWYIISRSYPQQHHYFVLPTRKQPHKKDIMVWRTLVNQEEEYFALLLIRIQSGISGDPVGIFEFDQVRQLRRRLFFSRCLPGCALLKFLVTVSHCCGPSGRISRFDSSRSAPTRIRIIGPKLTRMVLSIAFR